MPQVSSIFRIEQLLGQLDRFPDRLPRRVLITTPPARLGERQPRTRIFRLQLGGRLQVRQRNRNVVAAESRQSLAILRVKLRSIRKQQQPTEEEPHDSGQANRL